jgi:hypothetical protein
VINEWTKVIHGLPANITNKLQRVQNITAWLISRTKKHQHITPILVSLHWLPVHYRCQYKLLMYVFKSLHGSAPVYLQELDSVYQPTRSLRSEKCALIKSHRIRTKTYGERRFDKAAAMFLHTECFIEKYTQISDTWNITYNGSIERKTTIRKVLYPMFGCKNNQSTRSYLDSVLMWHCHLILLYDTTIWHYNMTFVSCVRNLGVFFDKTLSMEKQVSGTSKSCFNQIRNIGRIRTYITDDACKTLVNSLITSQLDYGNVMLHDLG